MNTNLNKKAHLQLYAYCVMVNGKYQSAIYNLQKRKLYKIPNSLSKVLMELTAHPFEKVAKKYRNDDTFSEYIEMLLNESLAYFSDQPKHFPRLRLDYNRPYLVSAALVEYKNAYSFTNLIDQLSGANCKAIEVRLPEGPENIYDLIKLLTPLEASTIRFADIIVGRDFSASDTDLEDFFSKLPSVNRLLKANQKENKILRYGNCTAILTSLTYEEVICRQFTSYSPIINYEFFSECQSYNPYYNNKVAVDGRGNIKNCLNHTRSFGNINDVNLLDVVKTTIFQKLWHASHDKILGLRDSELRYCTIITNDLKESKEHVGYYEIYEQESIREPKTEDQLVVVETANDVDL